MRNDDQRTGRVEAHDEAEGSRTRCDRNAAVVGILPIVEAARRWRHAPITGEAAQPEPCPLLGPSDPGQLAPVFDDCFICCGAALGFPIRPRNQVEMLC